MAASVRRLMPLAFKGLVCLYVGLMVYSWRFQHDSHNNSNSIGSNTISSSNSIGSNSSSNNSTAWSSSLSRKEENINDSALLPPLLSPKKGHRLHNNKQSDNDILDLNVTVDDNIPKGFYSCRYGPGSNETLIVPPKTPTLVLIGVQKSGTTSLLTYLKSHPSIWNKPNRNRREAHFFDSKIQALWKKHKKEHKPLTFDQKWCLALKHYTDELFPVAEITKHYQEQQQKQLQQQQHQFPNSNHHPKIKETTITPTVFTFEKTPSYFSSRDVPYRIKQTCPWCKVVLILRNPIDRAYSQYKMTTRNNYDMRNVTLEEFINHEVGRMRYAWNMTTAPLLNETISGPLSSSSFLSSLPPFHHPLPESSWTQRLEVYQGNPLDSHMLLRKGLYVHQLSWWLRYFKPDETMLIVDYQELARNTSAVYHNILDFAGIPPPPFASNETGGASSFVRAREDSSPNERPLSNRTRLYLQRFFDPYNARLASLLGPQWSMDRLGWK